MTNQLDDIERLVRLRDSGALTSEEFERQKLAIISLIAPSPKGKFNKYVLASIVATLVLLATLSAYFFGSNHINVATNVPTHSTIPTKDALVDNSFSINKSQTGIKMIDFITPDLIGASLGYVEDKIGKAKYISGNQREYEINGCKLSFIFDEDGVQSFSVPSSDSCTFNVRAFNRALLDEEIPLSNKLTLGKAASLYPQTPHWNCLQNCGNVEPPALYLVSAGSHIVDYHDIMVSIELDSSLPGVQEWIDKKSDSCDEEAQKEIISLLKDVKVDFIEIGFKVEENAPREDNCK